MDISEQMNWMMNTEMEIPGLSSLSALTELEKKPVLQRTVIKVPFDLDAKVAHVPTKTAVSQPDVTLWEGQDIGYLFPIDTVVFSTASV